MQNASLRSQTLARCLLPMPGGGRPPGPSAGSTCCGAGRSAAAKGKRGRAFAGPRAQGSSGWGPRAAACCGAGPPQHTRPDTRRSRSAFGEWGPGEFSPIVFPTSFAHEISPTPSRKERGCNHYTFRRQTTGLSHPREASGRKDIRLRMKEAGGNGQLPLPLVSCFPGVPRGLACGQTLGLGLGRRALLLLSVQLPMVLSAFSCRPPGGQLEPRGHPGGRAMGRAASACDTVQRARPGREGGTLASSHIWG